LPGIKVSIYEWLGILVSMIGGAITVKWNQKDAEVSLSSSSFHYHHDNYDSDD
jgi:hypothetical protein